MEFGRLQRHAEPEIRHHPLDSLVLAVYGFRGLSRAPEDRQSLGLVSTIEPVSFAGGFSGRHAQPS